MHITYTRNTMHGIIWSVMQEDAVYKEDDASYYERLYKKNARRAQRKAKQAQRNRFYDSF